MPAPVNHVIASYASQTGLGSINTNFAPAWMVTPGSLIAGQLPGSVGGGDFSMNGTGGVAVLTDGTAGSFNFWPGTGSSTTEVTCGSGAGTSVTYTLPDSAGGYNLTDITVYGGWGDAGRDQQAYTIYYSTIAAPATFTELTSVNYLPSNPAAVQCATRATLTPAAGWPATNVAAVMFDFTTPPGENGYEGYSGIDLYGFASLPPAPPTLGAPLVSGGNLILTGSGGANVQYQVQANFNLNTTNWQTIGTVTANAGGVIQFDDLIATNQQRFYRLVQ